MLAQVSREYFHRDPTLVTGSDAIGGMKPALCVCTVPKPRTPRGVRGLAGAGREGVPLAQGERAAGECVRPLPCAPPVATVMGGVCCGLAPDFRPPGCPSGTAKTSSSGFESALGGREASAGACLGTWC